MYAIRFAMLTIPTIILSASFTPTFAREEAQPARPRVSGGEICDECGFGPGVVSLRANTGQCTGTLIHPKVVLYAAHCGYFHGANATAEITHKYGLGRTVTFEKCDVHPGYDDDEPQSWDFAYCVLDEPVTDIPIVPAAFGCEFEQLIQEKQLVTICGFGQYTDLASDDRKRFGVSKITNVRGNVGYGEIKVGPHKGVVACPGDSGGPLLVQVEDGSWRVIGVASTYNMVCGENGYNTYGAVRTAVEWIEEETGIDITPCFTDRGHWYPTEDCGGFWASPDNTPYGTWDEGCPDTPVSGYSETCGDPYPDFEPDTDMETDSETDTDTDTETDTDTDPDEPKKKKKDDCDCATVGLNPSRPLLRLLF